MNSVFIASRHIGIVIGLAAFAVHAADGAGVDEPASSFRRSAVRTVTFAENAVAQDSEFYRGETYAMVGGTARHHRVILNLASRIGDHLDGTPCQVFAETMKAQLSEGVLYPDVMVTCGKADAGDELTVTDPVLIVEALSPSTKGYDKRDKFILYRTLASLREYVDRPGRAPCGGLHDGACRRLAVHG